MADVKRVQIDGIINDIVGKGMPSGGSAGQVLKKVSGSDYDTEWGTAAAEITVDDEINGTSTNPVQNRVIAQALDDVQSLLNDKITFPADSEDGKYLCYNGESSSWEASDLPALPIVTNWEAAQSDEEVPSARLTRSAIDRLDANKIEKAANVIDGIGYLTGSGNGTWMTQWPTWTQSDTTLSLSGRIADAKATGDALALKANAADVHSIPAGGGEGQILRKASTNDYDVYWGNVPGGSGGTSDYSDLTNKPSINGVELSGNKTAAQLSLATASEVAAKYTKPSTGIPASDLASAVQTSLGKADSALQSVPSTYRTAAAQDTIDAGKADKVTEVTVSTAGAVSQALDAGKIYHFTGALTALTITLNAASGPAQYHFDFLSGSTAPTLTLPNTVTMPDDFSVEANKRYEVDILDGFGIALSWGA